MRPVDLFQTLLALLSAAPGFVGHFFDQLRPRIDATLDLGEPDQNYVVCAFDQPLGDSPQYIHGAALARRDDPFVIYVPDGWYWLYAVEAGEAKPVDELIRAAQSTLYADPKAGTALPGNPYTSRRPEAGLALGSIEAQMNQQRRDGGGRDADDA